MRDFQSSGVTQRLLCTVMGWKRNKRVFYDNAVYRLISIWKDPTVNTWQRLSQNKVSIHYDDKTMVRSCSLAQTVNVLCYTEYDGSLICFVESVVLYSFHCIETTYFKCYNVWYKQADAFVAIVGKSTRQIFHWINNLITCSNQRFLHAHFIARDKNAGILVMQLTHIGY